MLNLFIGFIHFCENSKRLNPTKLHKNLVDDICVFLRKKFGSDKDSIHPMNKARNGIAHNYRSISTPWMVQGENVSGNPASSYQVQALVSSLRKQKKRIWKTSCSDPMTKEMLLTLFKYLELERGKIRWPFCGLDER